MSQSILFRLDAAIARSVSRSLFKNWKDTATVLGTGVFLVGAVVHYSASFSEIYRNIAAIISAGALGFGVFFFALSRLRHHAHGSPFALESLIPDSRTYYLIAWGLLSLAAALALSLVIAPSSFFLALLTWAAGAVTGYAAVRIGERSRSLQTSSSFLLYGSMRRYAGYGAMAFALGGIVFAALTDSNRAEATILILAANAAAGGLLTPVRPEEVRFFRIMGGGYARRCAAALVVLLAAFALQAFLIGLLLQDLVLLAMVTAILFGIISYRAIQIGLLRFLPPRIAELALAFGLMALLLLGFSFPPLVAVFLVAAMIGVGYRSWRANWLLR